MTEPRGDRPVLDQAVFDELVGVADEEQLGFVRGLFETYERESSILVDQMERGTDAMSVGHAAHALKGSSATIGAREVQELCAQIEAASAQGLDGRTSIAALRPALERVQRSWSARLAGFEGDA